MRKPRIGITMYGPGGSLESYSLPRAYVDAVLRAGGIPLLLPSSRREVESFLEAVDGLILAGGGDIDPARHAGGSHPSIYMISNERDDFELEVCGAALRRQNLPVLGICRGMQILNVALGGDLELHLPDVRGDQIAHRAPPREPTYHMVSLARQGPLAALYGKEQLRVCSWHHQELRRLGAGLEAVAQAPDGVIEAVQLVGRSDVLAVQWHPELQLESEPEQLAIFTWLIERASAHAERS